MKGLLWIELFKIAKQRKTYYALAAIFILEAFIMISAYYQGKGILDMLLENLKQFFEFKGNLLNGNLIIYLILNSLWFHIPLILMIIVSGFLTSEYKDRTIEAIFLHPVSRWRYILSKYVASVLFTILVIFVLIASTFSMAFAVFGNGDLVVFLDGLNFFEPGEAFQRLLLAFSSGMFVMLFYTVVSLTLAVILKESTITWIVSALFLVGTTMLLKFDFRSEFLNEFFFPKLIDSWQYFFYREIPTAKIIMKNSLLFGYTFFIGVLGIWIFQKRDIEV